MDRASALRPPSASTCTLTQLVGPPHRVLVLLCQVRLGSSLGGPYLGVHLRRKDFIWGHREDVPGLGGAVKRIRSLMESHGLHRVFVATDAVRTGELCRLPSASSGPGCVLGGPGRAY